MEDFGEGAKAIKYLSLFIALSLAYFILKNLNLRDGNCVEHLPSLNYAIA
jgi:hypothetical protein